MSDPPQPESHAPDEDPENPVWKLLGHARPISPSPHFARRVMTSVHADQSARQNRWHWLRRLPSLTLRPAFAMGALALLLAGAWALRSLTPQPNAHPTHPATAQASPAADDDEEEEIVQVVANELALLEDVDLLLDPEDGLDLDEEDIGRLLF